MSSDNELRDIKRTISSLLISNPNKSTILSLDREYKQMEGRPIPFRMFGFSSLDSFLRSMPDVLNVLGSGHNATLQVIVSKKVAHIDSLISKQKSSGKKRSGPQRSSRFYDNCTRAAPQSLLGNPMQFYPMPGSHYNSPRPLVGIGFNGYSTSMTPERLQPNLTYMPHSSGSERLYDLPRPHYDVSNPVCNSPQPLVGTGSVTLESPRPNLTRTPNSSGSERLSSSSYDSPRELTPQPSKSLDIPVTPPKSTTTLENNTGKCMLKVEDSTSFTSSTTSQQNLVTKMKDLTFSFSSAKTPISNFKVPVRVQENLLRLVQDHPDGIDCSMLPSLYRNKFKDEMNYNKYGYRNLIQMIKDFPNTYHCFRPDCGDYKIFDKSRPLPANLESFNKSAIPIRGACGGNKNKSLLFPDTALPENMLNISTIEYPPDVVKVKEIIARQFISDSLKEMDEIEVHVAEVYDPSKFWIILKKNYSDLEEMMGEMQFYYTSKYSTLKINEEHLEAGMFCVSIYEGLFHRALLTKVVLIDQKANVFYIDYGTVATVDSREIYFLTHQFACLSQQAIRARLSGVFPPVAQSPWSIEATIKFLSEVQYRVLIAEIYKIDREEQVLDLILYDKGRGKDGIINNNLVRSKLAIHAHQEPKRAPFSLLVPNVPSIYLFPTFHDLENILVPTLSELTAKSKLGISHNDIYPQYYEPCDPKAIDAFSSISEPAKRRKHLQEIYPDSSNDVEAVETQLLHPENENLLELFSESAMSQQYLTASYPNSINVIETTEEPLVLPKSVKPPPGFTNQPKNNQFKRSSINDSSVDSISCNNTVPVAKHENAQNTTIISLNRQEIALAIISILKKGHVIALYLMENCLKKFLVTSDVTENLMKYLKKEYTKSASDIVEVMVVDILSHFSDLQLQALCDTIKGAVSEFEIPQDDLNMHPSGESLLPPSTPSLPSPSSWSVPSSKSPSLPSVSNQNFPPPISSSSLLALSNSNLVPFSNPSVCQYPSFDGLSPLASPFVPFMERVEQKVSLNVNLSELSLQESERRPASHPQSSQSLPKFPIPTYQQPHSSSACNHDETAPETNNSQSHRKNKFAFKKILLGKAVHPIKFNQGIYIAILELQVLAKLNGVDIKTIKKNINLICDGGPYMLDINVNEHVQLEEELQRYGFKHDDEILSLIRVEFIPQFFKLFGNVVFPKSSFQTFLQEIYSETSES